MEARDAQEGSVVRLGKGEHGAGDVARTAALLIREAGRIFPGRLTDLDAWVPPWRAQPAQAPSQLARSEAAGGGAAPLAAYPATGDALASLLGCDDQPERLADGPVTSPTSRLVNLPFT